MGISESYKSVEQSLSDVCVECGRDAGEVRLVAVSKTVGVDGVAQAYEAGSRDFGENRPDPLVEKQAAYPDARWHFIGNIQSRRIKDIVPRAYMIHSLFEQRHALKINEVAASEGKRQKVLVEVNVSGEESKSGLQPADAEAFVKECIKLPDLEVCGLMTMAPAGDMDAARDAFKGLRELLARISESLDGESRASFRELSMGMTDDWPIAVEEGATIIRVGRAIFA